MIALAVFVVLAYFAIFSCRLSYIGGRQDGYRLAAERAGTLHAMKIAQINVALATLRPGEADKIFAAGARTDLVRALLDQHQLRLVKLQGDVEALRREHHA